MAKRKTKAALLEAPVPPPELPSMHIDIGPDTTTPRTQQFVPLKSCPQCGSEDDPSMVVHPIAICPKCGTTMFIGEHVYRRAIHSDIMKLNDGDIVNLRRARMAIVRR